MTGAESARVLVGVADGEAGAVLAAAVAEARRRGTGVHLVHAVGASVRPEGGEPWDTFQASLRREAAELLEATARTVGERAGNDVPVSTELAYEPVVSALIGLSAQAGVVFLERGSHRHVATLSTANGVAARAHTPVVVVPAGWEEPTADAPVVVGVERPEQSTLVVRAALEAARARGVGLRIVHAWHFSPAYDDLVFAGGDRTELETELRSSFAAALDDLLSTYPDVAHELVMQHGRPGDVLAREADDAGLVVLGRHQSRVPLAPHLGSVVRAVLRTAPCPVMVVDPLPATAHPGASPDEVSVGHWSESDPGNVVVAAVDGSPGREGVIRRAVQEARAVGAPLRLVHVVPDYVPVSIIPLTPDDMTETGRGILHAAEEVARAAAPDVRLESRLTRGPRARAIVEAAGDGRLLVVGRDRSLVERIVSGRTAAAVAGRSPCPVESVPPDWEAGRGHGPVVVGVRSTTECGPLLAHARGLAAERHARLVVLHAWKMASGYDDIIEARVATDELDRRPTAELAAVLDEIGSGLPEVPTEIRIVHDRPAHALVTASKDADLMVLMRRHHRGPDTWRLGATGRAVLGTARCSVRVVPPLGSPASSGAPLEASADLSGLSGR